MTKHELFLEDVAELATQWLKKHGFDGAVNLKDKEISVDHPMVRHINLDSLQARLNAAAVGDREGVLNMFLGVLNEGTSPLSAESYEAVCQHLRPIVRDPFDGNSQLAGRRNMPPDALPLIRPSVGDMMEGLVLDRPTSMERVTAATLAQWGVSFEDAWAKAMANLREHSIPRWDAEMPGIWMGDWTDGYESSRILLPELVKPLNLAKPVAFVPNRNALFVTEGQHPKLVELMVRKVADHIAKQPGRVSFKLYELVKGAWQVMTPPPGAAAILERLEKEYLASSYHVQTEMLLQQHERTGEEVFVANHQLMHREDVGLRSLAVWTRGVDTLLPQADIVTLLRIEDGAPKGRIYMVPWAEFMKRFSTRLQATDYRPARFRTLEFPSDEELDDIPVEFVMAMPGAGPAR